MSFTLIAVLLLLMTPQAQPIHDPNAAQQGAPRRPLGFKVFNNIDQPLTGRWEMEIPGGASRRIEIRELEAGRAEALVGVDLGSGEEILRLSRKKEGVGYEGQLLKVFGACALDTLPVSEFLPLGDAIVLRFETTPPSAPCPPIDGGGAGRFFAFSRKGGPVKLRDLSEISSSTVRESYSIGGDRPNVETSYQLPAGGVSIDDGEEVKFLQRVKAPLDSSYWFQVEPKVSAGPGLKPPRGFLRAEALRFVGSITLKRLKPEPPASR